MTPVQQQVADESPTLLKVLNDAVTGIFDSQNPWVSVVLIVGIVIVTCFWLREKGKKP